MRYFNWDWNYIRSITIVIIAIVLLSYLIISIVNPHGEEILSANQRPQKDYSIVKIDNCEYIEIGFRGDPSYNLVHKGNCSNPFHQHK
jgi:hypothetical protein